MDTDTKCRYILMKSLNNAANVQANQSFYQLQLNSTYTSYTNQVYTNAFAINNGTVYQDVTSAFKTLYYGPTSNSSTILGNIYYTSNIIFNQINNVLQPMIYAWGNLSALTQAGVVTQMTATITSSSTLQATLNGYMSNIGSFFNVNNY